MVKVIFLFFFVFEFVLYALATMYNGKLNGGLCFAM